MLCPKGLGAPLRLRRTHQARVTPRLSRAAVRKDVGSIKNDDASFTEATSVSGLDLPKIATATGAIVVISTLLDARAANAEERAWKPRRHHRRLDERFSNNWAEELVEVCSHAPLNFGLHCATGGIGQPGRVSRIEPMGLSLELVQAQEQEVDRKAIEKRRQEQLRREREEVRQGACSGLPCMRAWHAAPPGGAQQQSAKPISCIPITRISAPPCAAQQESIKRRAEEAARRKKAEEVGLHAGEGAGHMGSHRSTSSPGNSLPHHAGCCTWTGLKTVGAAAQAQAHAKHPLESMALSRVCLH